MTKKWYQSRVIWMAVGQAVVGIIVAFESQDPSFKALGIGAMAKSLLDVMLRLSTYMEIGKEE